jgi:DNA-directed RNA polymerase subunit beta'
VKKVALDRDTLVVEARRNDAEAAAALAAPAPSSEPTAEDVFGSNGE